MDTAKSYTHLYPAPFTFSQLHPPSLSSIHLHPAHFNLHSALSNTLSVIRIKNWMQLGNFPKLRPQNSNWSVLTENLHTWYLEGASSKSGLRVLKFRPPKNIFWANLSRKSKNVCFARKLTHTVSRGCWFLFGHYFSEVSNPDSILGKLGPKKVVRFAWQLARRVSRGCWFLFQY